MPVKEKHKCGVCEKMYATKASYLKHKCKKTGYKPNTAKHLDATSDGRFSLQRKVALKRGAARKNK